ncbi:MAG TPA: hypothetical protein VFW22_18155 [Pseudolabrys sp.]|nr:hypothetical protein [Pseudolabrys sp.]
MHPALHSWREELPAALVRALAYVGAMALLSIVAAHVFRSPPAMTPIAIVHSPWIEIERPFPAFALSIPEAANVPFHYTIRRHAVGGGRKDILELGEPDSVAPYLQVEIYRPGNEISRFAGPKATIATDADALGPMTMQQAEDQLTSKFGPLDIVTFETSKGVPRHCLAFVRSYDDPMLQLSGWFCRGGADFIERPTLACALDRLTLMSAGSEPKVGALFAQAELNRSFCGQRDPILASTPKYTLLWKALATRPEPRRIGR